MLNRIKKLCKEKNIAYKDLSDMTGISISTLSKMMAGMTNGPSIVTVSKIAKALNVSVDYLVYGERNTNEITINSEILKKYNSLNSSGKQKADEYITDLSEQKKYTASDEEDRTDKYNSSEYTLPPRRIVAAGAKGTKQITPPPPRRIT